MISTKTLSHPHQQLYDTDFIRWIDQAAELLKHGRFSELDIEHLVEEVEDLGRSQRQSLKRNLRVLLMHLLKWHYQAHKRSGSWKGSIREHRQRIQDAITDSPSLKNYYIEVFEESYATARAIATDETGLALNTFPTKCPYSTEQVLGQDFLPSEAS